MHIMHVMHVPGLKPYVKISPIFMWNRLRVYQKEVHITSLTWKDQNQCRIVEVKYMDKPHNPQDSKEAIHIIVTMSVTSCNLDMV